MEEWQDALVDIRSFPLLVNIILASIVIGCEEVCAKLSSMSNSQRI